MYVFGIHRIQISMYVSTAKRSNSKTTLLELTIRPQWSKQMKLSDLTSLRAQLMLATCLPEDFIKVNMLSLPIGTMIYLYKYFLIVVLI